MNRAVVHIRAGRERSLALGHPWILSGSVERVEGEPAPGELVTVVDPRGRRLAVGDWDPDAQIRVRVLGFGEAEFDEASWLGHALEAACAWRAAHPCLRDTDAVRLVHSEADGLPGLTVDRYGDFLALRVGSPGMLRRAERVAELLAKRTGARGAWLRGEKLASRAVLGEVPEAPIEIREAERRYAVDLRRGQKTGFYLDQRDARALFQKLARGVRALDLYAHTGGFAAAALAGGCASVVAVESSEQAARLLARNAPGAELARTDVGEFLRADARSFDLLAVDPPPFAKRKHDVPAACRAYQDVNRLALTRAAPGAQLLTFSCSHHLDAALFRKVVASAAADAKREVQFLGVLGAPVDHPVSARHPQGEYLKGLWLRVA